LCSLQQDETKKARQIQGCAVYQAAGVHSTCLRGQISLLATKVGPLGQIANVLYKLLQKEHVAQQCRNLQTEKDSSCFQSSCCLSAQKLVFASQCVLPNSNVLCS
jgi:hypothetical protein